MDGEYEEGAYEEAPSYEEGYEGEAVEGVEAAETASEDNTEN